MTRCNRYMTNYDRYRCRLANFLLEIERGMPFSNPYHNAVHCADVLQSMHMLISRLLSHALPSTSFPSSMITSCPSSRPLYARRQLW